MHVTCMVVLGSHVVLVRYHNTLAMLIVMGGEEIQRGFKKYSMDRHVRPPHNVRSGRILNPTFNDTYIV